MTAQEEAKLATLVQKAIYQLGNPSLEQLADEVGVEEEKVDNILIIDIWRHNLFGIGTYSFVIFLYWTVMEGAEGQSIGKMVLNIKVTDRKGKKINFGKAAIESFGKAFLLPIDCLIGWIAMSEENLRLFNRISSTILIKTEYKAPEGVNHTLKRASSTYR